jgi:zinc transporter ZupT
MTMTRTATQTLLMTASFVLLLMAVSLSVIDWDSDGTAGASIGAAVGVLNLVVGYAVTQRALRHGMRSATATVAGGFIARLFVVVGLMLLFRGTDAVDPTAFALVFLVFFFVYLGVEVLLVERSASRRREVAA